MTENSLPQNDPRGFEMMTLLLECKETLSKQAYAAMMMGLYQVIEEANGAPDPELRDMIAMLALEAAAEDEEGFNRELDEVLAYRAEYKRQRQHNEAMARNGGHTDLRPGGAHPHKLPRLTGPLWEVY